MQEDERDELKEEQSEVPASEFDKQPSSMDSVKQTVSEATDSIISVASRATESVKQMTVGDKRGK